MRESVKSVLALVIVVAICVTVVVWWDASAGPLSLRLRFGAPVVGLIALGILLKIHFREDIEKDYLLDIAGDYFNSKGFCFTCHVVARHGQAYLETHFQNQYERPCIGKVALRPAKGFFLTRAKIEGIYCEIECGPAAFGVARIAIPVPAQYQGKRQSFEVGVSVSYPNGKGRRLRFQDGLAIRSNAKLVNGSGMVLALAGAAAGSIVISNPATVTVQLPSDVNEELAEDVTPEFETLWKLGDPPLAHADC